jgi:DNA repair protein RecO (recombination protein O)
VPRTERSLKVEAIVLRHADWGEADRLVTIYSREEGKLRAIAKGVRKMRSRKAGHLEPFTRVKLLLAKGHDLWIITQAEAVNLHSPIRESLDLTAQAAYVVELLDRFTYEEGANWHLYKLLADTLEQLAVSVDFFIPIRFYEMRLLDMLGFRPLLFKCASCEEEIQPRDQYFSSDAGGVLCPNCREKGQSTRPISMEALRYLRHIQRSPFSKASQANPPEAVRLEMEGVMNYYLTYLLERGLNSPEFIKQIRR